MNILSITNPADIFSYDVEGDYRKLAKQYHPDTYGSNDAFIRLTHLYEEAQKLLVRGIWVSNTSIIVVETGCEYGYLPIMIKFQ